MSDTIIHLVKYGVTACLLPGVPGQDWPDNHKWVPEAEKHLVNCRACLEGMKCGDPTFEILEDGKAIKCRRCGMTSHSPKDVEHRWCGNCKVSHEDLWPPARRAWVQSYAEPS